MKMTCLKHLAAKPVQFVRDSDEEWVAGLDALGPEDIIALRCVCIYIYVCM